MLRKLKFASQLANQGKLLPSTMARAQGVQASSMGPHLDDKGEPRFLEQVKLFLQRAGSRTEIPPDVYELIQSCASVIRFSFPVVMDDGRVETISAYR